MPPFVGFEGKSSVLATKIYNAAEYRENKSSRVERRRRRQWRWGSVEFALEINEPTYRHDGGLMNCWEVCLHQMPPSPSQCGIEETRKMCAAYLGENCKAS